VEVAKVMSDGGREIASGLEAKSAEIDEALRTRAQALTEALSSLAREINGTLGGNLNEMTSTLSDGVSRLQEQILVPLDVFSTNLDKSSAAIRQSIDDTGGVLNHTLSGRIDEIRALIDGKGAEFVAQLGARGEEISERIAGVGENAAQAFDKQTTSLMSLMTRRSEDLLASINAGAAGSVRSLGALTSQLSAEVETTAAALRVAAQEATTSSTDAVSSLRDRLRAEVEATTEALRVATQETTAGSTDAVSGLRDRLRTEVEATTAALQVAAREATASSTSAVAGLRDRLHVEVEESGALLREALERSAGASVNALNSTGDRLRNELSLVLDRLGDTSTTLERIVGSAGTDLDAIQTGLAERVVEFQRSLGAISSQVAGLNRTSSMTQAEATVLVDRLAEHTNALAGAAHDLSTTQESIDAALDRRRASLQTLMGDVARKSEDFESLMRSFATTVEDSFNKAQTRAKEINAALMMTTNGASATVSSQFELIRDNADKERERTSAALQAAYDQANSQLAGIMNQTTERFKQSAAEVRSMAGDIQRDLDATRQELRRGVLELPQETSEQAGAMRRVISDQIKALNELAGIVSNSDAGFDVSEATASAPPPPAPAPAQPPAQSLTPQRIEPPRSIEPPSVIELPGPVEFLRPISQLSPVEAPRAGRSQSTAPAAPTNPAQRAQAGWLSDLLSRASRDEQPAPGGAAPNRPANDALDAIAVNIASLIDSDAAAEMWDRWRRGDNDAFSRRLYTAQGQQTFDEIRRRCRADPQFRDTVERYTQEFERLLAKVGQNDRDGSQARAYLLSDTGKVYTMLAHASGRMG
jgi:hypothetical protein